MKRIITKILLALAAVTLIGTIAAPMEAIAMTEPGTPVCAHCGATKSCLCSSLESVRCGSTKYEHGVLYTLGCIGDGATCKPVWMKAPTPSQVHVVENKATAQPPEEKKIVETTNTTSHDFSEPHSFDWNTISQLYATNPELFLNDAAIANLNIEEYNAQMIAYYYAYANQLALYGTMMDDANARLSQSLCKPLN